MVIRAKAPRRPRGKIGEAAGDKVFSAVNFLFVTIFFLIVLYPLVFVVSASFSDPVAVIQNKVRLLPVGFSLEGYKAVFNNRLIVSGFLNSLFYVAAGTTVNLIMTVLAAYPLSRDDFPDRGVLMKLFTFTMLFSAGMIPNYLLIRDLGLIDTRTALILPGAIGVYNMIVTRTFFQNSLPKELLEAAHIDGCSDFTFLLRIAIPLSKPILAVMCLFYAVGHWNSYFSAMMYLSTPDKYPLQIILRDILVKNEVAADMIDLAVAAEKEYVKELLKYSLIVVSSAPLMVLYPFIQKFFVKGVMIGSVKG